MLVSIITPCFNSAHYVSDAITSVIKQSYENWELIIVNDCSTDDSEEIIERFVKSDQRIKTLRLTKNSGVSEARNAGVRIASGSFIAFLDSDDIWDRLKLEKQVRFMVANGYDFTHTSYRTIDSEGRVICEEISARPSISYSNLLKQNEIGCLTSMYNVDKLGKFYFPSMGHEDYATWLNILKAGNRCWGLNQVLASYRVHNDSVSSNKLKAARFTWSVLRNSEKLPLFLCIFYFATYSKRSLIKLLKSRGWILIPFQVIFLLNCK